VSRNRPHPVAVDDMAAGTVLIHPMETNLAALGLIRYLAECYRTAWCLKHKLMQPMQTHEAIHHPGGLAIQIDDTCLGGNVTGKRRARLGEQAPLVIAVSSDAGGRPGLVIVEPLSGFNSKARTTARRLEPDIEVCSDRLGAFLAAIDHNQGPGPRPTP